MTRLAVAVRSAYSSFGLTDLTVARRVLANTSINLGTSLAVRLLSPILALVAARILTVTEYGQFSFALDYSTVALNLLSLAAFSGFSTDLLRTGATHAEAAQEKLVNMLAMLLLIYIPAAGLSLGLLVLLPHPATTLTVAAIFMVFVAISNSGTLMDAYVRGLERFRIAATRVITQQALIVLLGVSALVAGFGLAGIGLAFLIGAIAGALVGVGLLARNRLLRAAQLRPSRWVDIGRKAVPLSLLYLFLDVYWRGDSVLLGVIAGADAVAVYAVSFRFIYLFVAGIDAFEQSIFPPLTRAALNPVTYSRSVKVVLTVLITVATAAMIVLTVFGPEIVGLLFTAKYQRSVAVLEILSVACLFLAGYRACNLAILALHRERILMWLFPPLVIGSLIANGIAIARFSYSGAAVVMVVTQFVLFATYVGVLAHVAKDWSISRYAVVLVSGALLLAVLVVFLAGRLTPEWLILTVVLIAALVLSHGIAQLLFRPHSPAATGVA